MVLLLINGIRKVGRGSLEEFKGTEYTFGHSKFEMTIKNLKVDINVKLRLREELKV